MIKPPISASIKGLWLLVMLAITAPYAVADPVMHDHDVAVLGALDKITGRTHTLRVMRDQPETFGTLTITTKACRATPPEQSPESAAFLVVDYQDSTGRLNTVFSGWMFASSPAVSAMEHPMFDIWVLSCADAQNPPAASSPESTL